jgi:hypothetical protein
MLANIPGYLLAKPIAHQALRSAREATQAVWLAMMGGMIDDLRLCDKRAPRCPGMALWHVEGQGGSSGAARSGVPGVMSIMACGA